MGAEKQTESAEKTAEKPSAKPKPLRAGGHINRLDGKGWVVDMKD